MSHNFDDEEDHDLDHLELGHPRRPLSKTIRENCPLQTLPLSQIELPPYQPRQYFDPDKLEQLAETIRSRGILEPLLVRQMKSETYEVIAGGRRYRAAKLAALTSVPVVICNCSDEDALEIALLENIQREDLNPLDETEGILKLLSVRLKLDRDRVISLLYRMRNDFKRGVSRNVSAREVAAVAEIFAPLGLSWKSFVETRLSLLNKPPDILDAVRQGKIAYTKAMAIAKIPGEEQRKRLLQEAIAQNLSLKTIRKRIQDLQQPGDRSPSLQARIEDTYRHLKAAKIWENPAKCERLQHLLAQLEELLTSD